MDDSLGYNGQTSLLSLSPDLLQRILSLLDGASLFSVVTCCKTLSKVTDTPFCQSYLLTHLGIQQALSRAACYGQVPVVRSIIQHFRHHEHQSQVDPAIHLAAIQQALPESHHADLDDAVRSASEAFVIQLLLDAGASTLSALIKAASINDTEMVTALLAASPAVPPSYCNTLVRTAALKGNLHITEALLHAPSFSMSQHILTASLDTACAHGHTDVAKLLLNFAEEHRWPVQAGRHLHAAASSGSLPLLHLLLQLQPRPSPQQLNQAVTAAITCGHAPALELLMGTDLDPDLRQALPSGTKILSQVCLAVCGTVTAEMLIPLCSFHDVDPALHWAPLAWACHSGNLRMVRLLLSMHVPIHELALQWAAAAGHAEVLRSLLAAGATPSAKAAVAAVSGGHLAAVRALLECGGSNNPVVWGRPVLRRALATGVQDVVDLLLEFDLNLNAALDHALIVDLHARGHAAVARMLRDQWWARSLRAAREQRDKTEGCGSGSSSRGGGQQQQVCGSCSHI